jgi:AcrR family transcriptional regulator
MARAAVRSSGRRRRDSDPAPRRRPAQARSAATFDAILVATERVLGETGLAAFNTNRVAEVAGVSVGTLYQYFPNKESLIATLYERYDDQFRAAFRTATGAAPGVPLAELFAGAAAAMVAVFRSQGRDAGRPHRLLYRMRFELGMHEIHARSCATYADELRALLVARGVEPAHAGPMAFVMVHAVDGVIHAIVDDGDDAAIDARVAELVRLIGAFVTARTSSASARGPGA